MPISLILSILGLAAAAGVAAYAVQAGRDRGAVLERVLRGERDDWASRTKTSDGVLARIATWLAQRMPAWWNPTGEAATTLVHAGYDGSAAPAVYALLRLTSAIVVPLIALVTVPRRDTALFVVILGLAVAIGFVAPPAILARLAESRREALRRALPDSMDLLVVCVEAGVSLDAAILRVAKEMATLHADLADEFFLVNRRVNAGMPREQALHGLAERTGLDELRGLASNMIQSERWGTSIATVLRIYAETLRKKRKQTAEKRAATAPLKMLFPLGVFIFPSIFIVIVGPAALKIYAIFVNMNH